MKFQTTEYVLGLETRKSNVEFDPSSGALLTKQPRTVAALVFARIAPRPSWRPYSIGVLYSYCRTTMTTTKRVLHITTVSGSKSSRTRMSTSTSSGSGHQREL